MHITSVKNETVKECKALLQRSKRKQKGLFIIEGKKMLQEALLSGQKVPTVFVREGESLPSELTELLKKQNAQIHEAAPHVIEVLTETESPQGVVAVCAMPQREQRMPEGSCLLLDGVSDPGNMGTIIRTADAMGLDTLLLSGCVDIYNPKVVRSTMGSLFRQNIRQVEDSAKAMEELKAQGYQVYASVLDRQAKSICERPLAGKVCVVIGNEAKGVSPQAIAASSGTVFIDMAGGAESLNAAVAASIFLWEMSKQNRKQ